MCITVQVGAELMFRVLGCKSKRITVTHKKSLVRSLCTIHMRVGFGCMFALICPYKFI